MNKLFFISLLLVSFGSHSLYLHDDAPEESVSVNSAELIGEARQFCSWATKTLKSITKLIGFSTLSGSDELEKECLERNSSSSYKILQVASFIGVPLVSATLSGAGLEDIVLAQVPLFLWFYGPDMLGTLAQEVVSFIKKEPENKQLLKPAIDKIKTLQTIIFLYAFPAPYIGAIVLDKFSNEVASRCTHCFDCSENTKNILFFVTKNLVRSFVFLDGRGAFSNPTAGKSDYPDDFRVNMTKVYEVSKPDYQYEIHLMWLNDAIQGNNTYVFPSQDRHQAPITDHVFGWSKIGDATSVSLWYDPRFTTREQVEATENLFTFHNLICGETCSPLELRDISTLEFYNEHQSTFSRLSEIPGIIWALTDILRLVILHEGLKQCNECIITYQDLDNLPLNKAVMLNKLTIEKLAKFGIVMHQRVEGSNGHIQLTFPENSMLIMSKDNYDPKIYDSILGKLTKQLTEKDETGLYHGGDRDFVYNCFNINLFEIHWGMNRSDRPSKCTPTISTPIDANTTDYFN